METRNNRDKRSGFAALSSYIVVAMMVLLASCAKMGRPDGGWYDEEPPVVIGCMPSDKAVNVSEKKINIFFNEYIKLENASEKVVVSPPQKEMPDIKDGGKKITVKLFDTLRANTTYTIDFSDAIVDNNEGNPMGNYTYSFSTGAEIDTFEVAGHVIDAASMEPVQGIHVGLYNDLADSAFTTKPMLRVSRTDSRGHFVIKGVAPGKYRVFALGDVDDNYMFSQKGERVAFNNEVISPSSFGDIRQDTVWQDTLHIAAINRTGYIHYIPDDIVLRAFTETLTDRYFLKAERKEENNFKLVFSYGDSILPVIRGLNFDEKGLYTEYKYKKDSITYWLNDSALIKQDTLRMEVKYNATDTLGVLSTTTDTLELTAPIPFEKRQETAAKEHEKWQKKQDKAKKKGEKYLEKMPADSLEVKYNIESEIAPDMFMRINIPTPVADIDTTKIRLYAKHDSLWYDASYTMEKADTLLRTYFLKGDWHEDTEYSFEADTCAFRDIYGQASKAFKKGFKVRSGKTFGSLTIKLGSMRDSTFVMQLLNSSGNMIKEEVAKNGKATFKYLDKGSYYLRGYIDRNGNKTWDTGCYKENLQPETMFYYPEKIECKEKWDITQEWNPDEVPADRQKPSDIIKNKPEKQKEIMKRNMQRAKKLGIEYIKK